MTDVMIDLETFGNGKNACIVQIGALYFNRETGETGNWFKLNVDARTSVKHGAEIDADTVYWWLKQSPEAIASVTNHDSMVDIISAMHSLNKFLENAKYIWSHATFDMVIINETFKRLGMKPSYSYRSARDIRTLVDLAGVEYSHATRQGTHHDALEDCKFQVQYCVEAMNKLRRP